MMDQNGTVHQYDFDVLGRPTVDRVTTLGGDRRQRRQRCAVRLQRFWPTHG
jgi:hypothetical protein